MSSEAAPAKKYRTRTFGIVVAVLMLVVIAVLATRQTADSVVAPSVLIGKPAPAFTAKSLDGETISLSSYRGKPVVVNFFASWCVPCHEEQPDLIQFNKKHSEAKDAALVAVLFDDSPKSAKEYLEANGATWPTLIDQGSIAIDYGVRAPPETFIIDANGYVRQRFVGAVTYDALEESINELNREAEL